MARADERLVAITPAMREGSGLVRFSQEFPRPLLRRGHRRAARDHLRRGPRGGGHEARGRDLLDLPAARLRPADPRRGAPGPAGGLRARPRGPGGRRRSDAPRSVRFLVPALHPEHDGDGAGRRERMPPDALHRLHARNAHGSVRYPRGTGRRRRGAGGDEGAAGRARRSAARRQARRDPRLRLDAEARARGRRGIQRDRRQHALREAARSRSRLPAGDDARARGDGRGERRRGRRRLRGRGSARRRALSRCRCWRSGFPSQFVEHGDQPAAARRLRPRCRRHRARRSASA